MKFKLILLILLASFSLTACTGKEVSNKVTQTTEQTSTIEAATMPETTTEAVVQYIPNDSDYVKVKDYIPSIIVDLRYATTDNFTGQVIYNFTDAYLRYGTVKKLAAVQAEANQLGYSIKIWDAYRPLAAQFKMWEVVPNSTYVANPNKGPSSHNLGNCIDMTLVTLDGSDIEMPTGFDDFHVTADRDYSDVSQNAANNARMLENIMYKNGFKGYSGEWWHFMDTTDYAYIEFTP